MDQDTTPTTSSELAHRLEKEREHLLQERITLLESTSEGIYGIDMHGYCTFINRAGAALLGYTHDELLHKNMHVYIHHSHADGSPYPEKECPIFQALHTKQGVRLDNECLWRKNGSSFPAEYSSSPIIKDGTVQGAVVTFTDITERKELEQRKDEFISMASHELRSPITAIKGNLQLAERRIKTLLSQQETLSPEVDKVANDVSGFLSRALRQIEIQNRLINDLLDMSRISSNKLELSPELCDLRTIVRNVVEDQHSIVLIRSLILDMSEDTPVLVMADKDRIGQVINNYLTNAIKYSDASQPIKVGVQIDGENARIWVQDRGPGLSTEAQKHIWERFYQAPGVEVKSGSGIGLGLGLHICQRLIQRHGGEVGVDSVQGKGSTFWFTLPLAK